MRKNNLVILFFCLLFFQAGQVAAQVERTVYEPIEKKIVIVLDDKPEVIDGVKIQAGNSYPCPLIYFKEELTAQRILLYCNVEVDAESSSITLKNFRTMPTVVAGDEPDDLISGANPPSPVFPAIPRGTNRTYFIQFEAVQVERNPEPSPVSVSVKLSPGFAKPPFLTPRLVDGKFVVAPEGITVEQLLKAFKSNPGLITIVYDFSGTDREQDPIPTRAASIEKDKESDFRVIITPERNVPDWFQDYKAVIKIPWGYLREESLPAEWAIPPFKTPEADFLTAGVKVPATLDQTPERKNSEFSFDAAFTSVVKPSIGKRNNVGVFGLYIKPTIKTFNFGTGRGEKNPSYIDLRPLFEADVDTQPIKDSKAPNRILMGFDAEYGKNLSYDLFRQFVWINGFRYDSDRDFKLQTMYWHTEFVPYFKKFESLYGQRLFIFNTKKRECKLAVTTKCEADKEQNCSKIIAEKCGSATEPLISSYFVRPSIGYQLGGTIKRDARDLTTPTQNISRAFFRLNMGIEFKRLIKFTVDDTYYHLENAPRRKNRNYIETTAEFNLSRFAKFDLNGVSNSIFLKFQGGELPPDFGRVNLFSAGFKIFY